VDAKSDKRPAASAEKVKVTTPSEREIAMARTFDAPRELLYRAWTTPELLKRWLYGPDDWRLTDCEIDLKVGGAIRWVWRHHDGGSMGLRGVYREIAPPDRLVFTELFDNDWTQGETLVTMTFVEHAGKTTVTQSIFYSSKAARDGALKSGMEGGMSVGYDRLEALLPSLSDQGTQQGARA
jgi:uncharacterized protein YndB with AHSA1/START domain